MSHSPSQRRRDKEMARRQAEADAARAAEIAAARDHAARIVRLWNARAGRGRPPVFYPTIGATIVAGQPFLTYLCPACQQVGEVDVRTIQRHPGATIASLIPALSCQRCSPNPPFARLIGLAEGPTIMQVRRQHP